MNSLAEIEKQIKFVRDTFTEHLFEKKLKLLRTTAPLFIKSDNGVNDDLNGQSEPIKFKINKHNINVEIVQSLSKWKRLKLHEFEMQPYEGIYTNMNAIRNNELLDELHSAYVDQWDWEMVISNKDRNIDFLRKIVDDIYKSIYYTETKLAYRYNIPSCLPCNYYFIKNTDLMNLYPNISQAEREYNITKKYGAVFICCIDNSENRASDYDDWNLNGDLLIWSNILNKPIEITSMGIRVDAESLKKQLKISNEEYKGKFDYHKMILNNELPLTIGGGIGQSRLCMLLLHKNHIKDVQSSVWDPD